MGSVTVVLSFLIHFVVYYGYPTVSELWHMWYPTGTLDITCNEFSPQMNNDGSISTVMGNGEEEYWNYRQWFVVIYTTCSLRGKLIFISNIMYFRRMYAISEPDWGHSVFVEYSWDIVDESTVKFNDIAWHGTQNGINYGSTTLLNWLCISFSNNVTAATSCIPHIIDHPSCSIPYASFVAHHSWQCSPTLMHFHIYFV